MLFFVTGASGSGKTACIKDLKHLLQNVEFFDFDDVGVPENADKIWRQQSTEYWIKKAIECQKKNKDICVCGTAVLGEILSSPSVSEVKGIAVCLLDCSDWVRVERLRKRGTHGAHQDMLNWAAWLRMHTVDPQWHQNVIKENSWKQMSWDRWDTWQKGNENWDITYVIDTTSLTIGEVAKCVANWITKEMREK